MRQARSRLAQASAAREVAYPVEDVWRALATLLPYCSVCDVSVVVDGSGALGPGTEFRAFPGRAAQSLGTLPPGSGGGGQASAGGMPGVILDWLPGRAVATQLTSGEEIVVMRVNMVAASPDTTLVTIGVEVAPRSPSRLTAAMTRSAYTRMAKRTVVGEIDKLPAHLALLKDR